jgi:nitrogen fixation protein NifQ
VQASPAAPDDFACAGLRADEASDVYALLLDHAAHPQDRQTQAVAREVALACLGEHHLWEDLQLPSREALWGLLGEHFPSLVAANHARMRWKKFLYRELCRKEEILICRSPSCETCPERTMCFAPEVPGH